MLASARFKASGKIMQIAKALSQAVLSFLLVSLVLESLPKSSKNSALSSLSPLKNSESLISKEELRDSKRYSRNFDDQVNEVLQDAQTDFNPFSTDTFPESHAVEENLSAASSPTPEVEIREITSESSTNPLDSIKILIRAASSDIEESEASAKLAQNFIEAPAETLQWIESNADFFEGEYSLYLNNMLRYPYTSQEFEGLLTQLADAGISELNIYSKVQKKLFAEWYLQKPEAATQFLADHSEPEDLNHIAKLQKRRKELKQQLGWEPIYPKEEVMSRDPASAEQEKELRDILLELQAL